MAHEADRANLSLHAANLLRDRYARVVERVGRRGRPRARFLAERRAHTAAAMVPTLAAIAAITGATAAVTLVTEPASLRAAAIAQACVAIVVGAAALAVPLVRKNTSALLGVGSAGLAASLLGWGLVARLSGGETSPWLLVVPAIIVVGLGLVPLPPRVAAPLAATGYLALLVASPASPPWAHLFVASVAVGGYVSARARQRRAVASFLKVERLAANVARLRRMQEQLVLVEKLEALRVLVGGIAHELNNALAVAMASTQQAAKIAQTNPESAAAALKRADGGLSRIRTTIERLRRFAMASEGVLEAADVAAMLDFALESAIGRARSGVAVERDYDPQVGSVHCHVAALAEALYQVARNAVEAMPAGGRLRASVRAEGDRVVLTVADEGKGIAPDALKRIFDPYWRVTIAGNRSGMGLSAVYGIVTALGGSVRVQSGEGKGTTVSILLPRRGA
ncbi:MAG TPA: HAMP domain-containing sensor histidine kinase [Polyangiaceae bacterium]|jgi:signal transduction histidine kinase